MKSNLKIEEIETRSGDDLTIQTIVFLYWGFKDFL